MSRHTSHIRRTGELLAVLLAGTAGVAFAQNAVLRGTVRSDIGELVEGASVLIPEMAIQTATTASGGFLISLPEPRVQGQTVTLVIRMVGFRPHRQAITVRSGEQVFDVILQADVNRLEDIVVTGVMEGTAQNVTTFSVARLNVEDLPVPAADPLSQLAGRLPGVTISFPSARPGASPEVLLRGPTSINATGRPQRPLLIVDGVIIDGGSLGNNPWLGDFNALDVEDIEVVKGAAGASLYGARAANGVVNVTTRSGRTASGGVSFRIRAEAGFNDRLRGNGTTRQHVLLREATGERFCVADNTQPLCARTVDWVTEATRVNNAPGNGADYPAAFTFDPGVSSPLPPLRQVFQASLWPVPVYDQVRQTTTNQAFVNTNIDATGRLGDMRFFASASQLTQRGATRFLDGSTRYTARLNVDQQIRPNLSLALRTFYSHSRFDGWAYDGAGDFWSELVRQPGPANLLARDTLGRIYARTNLRAGNGPANPIHSTAEFGFQDENSSDHLLAGGTIRWAPTSWSDLEANFSYDYTMGFFDYLQPKGARWPTPLTTPFAGYLQASASGAYSYNTSVNLTVRHALGPSLAARWQLRYLFDRIDRHRRGLSGSNLAVQGVDAASNATLNQSINSDFQSERLMGLFAGVNLDYRQRVIGDFLVRRDGSSLFGAGHRWATFGRASAAYRPSQERWWPFRDALNEFKLRASLGTAGGRPSFSAQYETYSIGSGGALTAGTLGNRYLRPETNTEREVGADIEMFRRIGVTVTYAYSDTRDQILLVPAPASSGFNSQWRNAGTLTSRTWELSLNLPVVRRRDLSWSWRFNYDRTRTVVTRLNVPTFYLGMGGPRGWITVEEGQRYGLMYGLYLLRGAADCARLPAPLNTDCGTPGAAFQVNSDGWLVWTGGYGVGEGLSRNLWMTRLPAASAPWGVELNWGMPINLRDSTNARAKEVPLGHGLPNWHFSVSQTLQFRRFTLSALLEGLIGRSVWNVTHQWMYLDLVAPEMMQRGRRPEEAKPLGYYWRPAPPEGAGLGGLYQGLQPTNESVEDASFVKLRELSLSYRLGRMGDFGSWEISLIGRNVFTITRYRGWDPEIGWSPQSWGGQTGSGLVSAVDQYGYPALRTLTIALSTTF